MKISEIQPFVYNNKFQLQMFELRKEFEHIMLLHDVVASYTTKNITEIHTYPKGNTHNS